MREPATGRSESPGLLSVTITSLEMRQAPNLPAADRPPGKLRIERAMRPTLAFYRFLYDTVGEGWLWSDRRGWPDRELLAVVQDPAVEIWVLSVDGQPAGYAELDRRRPKAVELAYFGLMPQFIGRRLGPHLLRFAIGTAWTTRPNRLWVHTCTFDHPSALGLYRRHGFVPFGTTVQSIEDPRLDGRIRLGAAPHIPLAERY